MTSQYSPSQEISETLKIWANPVKNLYLNGNENLFTVLHRTILDLIKLKGELLQSTVSSCKRKELSSRAAALIDWANKKLNLDLVPRKDGSIVDSSKVSMVQLYDIHKESEERASNCRTPVMSLKPSSKPSLSKKHIFVRLKDVEIKHFPSDSVLQICFNIFDANESKYLSHQFAVKTFIPNRKVCEIDADQLLEEAALFTNFEKDDPKQQLYKDLYLVIKLFRKGPLITTNMQNNDKNGKSNSAKCKSQLPNSTFRRPFACAVYGLSSSITGLGSHKNYNQAMRMYTCADADFAQIHQLIINKQTTKATLLSDADLIATVQIIEGIVPYEINLNGIRICPRLNDIDQSDDIANVLRVTVESAEVDKGGRGSPRSIQVALQLIDDNGEIVKEPCSHWTAESNGYCSFVQYHCNSPCWNETINIGLSNCATSESLSKTHLRFLITHCTAKEKYDRKLASFSFLPILRDKITLLPDKYYALAVYKCDDISKLKDTSRYLGLAWNVGCGNAISEISEFHTPPNFENNHFSAVTKDVLRVKFQLISSSLTQNEKVSNFLHWRQSPDFFLKTLENLTTVPLDEIFKVLPQIMNGLINLLATDSSQTTPNSLFVFRPLVYILTKIDSHEASLKFERYLTHDFTSSTIHRVLFEHINSAIKNAQDQLNPERDLLYCQNIVSSFETLSKMAYLSFKMNTECEFQTKSMYNLWLVACTQFAQTLAYSDNDLIPIQCALMTSLTPALSHWSAAFSTQQLSDLISVLSAFFDCPLSSNVDKYAILCANNLIQTQLFQNSDICITLLPSILTLVQHQLPKRNSLNLLRDMLHNLLSKTLQSDALDKQSIIVLIANGLIELIVGTIIATDRSNDTVTELVSYLFEVLRNMKSPEFLALKKSLFQAGGKKRLKDFLFRIFLVFRDLVKSDLQRSGSQSQGDLFPQRWFAIKANICSIMLCCMRELSEMLSMEFNDVPSFDCQLWNTFFTLCSSFIVQPCLRVTLASKFSGANGCQDMRVIMGYQFINMWNKLDQNQKHLTPGIVGSLLEISIVAQEDIRKSTIPIFCEVFDIDYEQNGSLDLTKCELFDKLDLLVSGGGADNAYKSLFAGILREFIANTHPKWEDEGKEVVNKATCLLEKLLAYRAVADSKNDDGLDKQMFCAMGLLTFYREEIRRDEMYIRYIYKLHHLLIDNNHTVEAAATLKLHADLLNWDTNELSAEYSFPAQVEWQRKKSIYEKVVEYYEEAKCWERGIALCKELVIFYESHLYDYKRLGNNLRRIASFYEKILEPGERERPQYFRVSFIGVGFPTFVANKTFIYRGHAFEKLSSFTHRLSNEWPGGIMLAATSIVDDTLTVANKQYLQVSSVRPIPSHAQDSTTKPDFVKRYYEHNEVDRFEYNRPVSTRRNSGDSDKQRLTDFQNLWTERTTLRTASTLPSILPWSEVLEESVERVSPVQNACITIQEKNEELKQIVAHYSNGRTSGIVAETSKKMKKSESTSQQPLLMILKGTIEAAVNGGIAMYQQAFFNVDYSTKFPGSEPYLQDLQMHLWEQMQLLEKGLQISGQLVSDECRPLHDYLCKCFDKLRKDMKRSLDSPQVHRHSVGSFPTKFSMPSTPESAVMSMEFFRSPNFRNIKNSRPVSGGMSSSWDATLLLQSEDEDDQHHVNNGHDEDLLAPLCRSAGPRQKGRKGSRPKSTHLEDLVNKSCSTSVSVSTHTNLSDSNIASHLSGSSRGSSPSRLRRFISRLGGSGTMESVNGREECKPVRPGRSPRNSDDSGIERHVTSRSRSPRWPRKFVVPSITASKVKPPPYQPLMLSRETTPDTLLPCNPNPTFNLLNNTPPRTQSLEIKSLQEKSRTYLVPRSTSKTNKLLKQKGEASKFHDISRVSLS